MKKTVLLLTLIFYFATASLAQDCSAIKDRKDPFTGQFESYVKLTFGGLARRWSIEFKQTDELTIMKWGIAITGEYNQVVEKGTSLLLKLEDGTVLDLTTAEQASPVTQVAGGGGSSVAVFSIYYLKFNLSDKTLKALSKSPITNFKIEVGDQAVKNPSMSRGKAEEILEICGCLLESY